MNRFSWRFLDFWNMGVDSPRISLMTQQTEKKIIHNEYIVAHINHLT